MKKDSKKSGIKEKTAIRSNAKKATPKASGQKAKSTSLQKKAKSSTDDKLLPKKNSVKSTPVKKAVKTTQPKPALKTSSIKSKPQTISKKSEAKKSLAKKNPAEKVLKKKKDIQPSLEKKNGKTLMPKEKTLLTESTSKGKPNKSLNKKEELRKTPKDILAEESPIIEEVDFSEEEPVKKPKIKKTKIKKAPEPIARIEIKRAPLPDLSAINYNNFKKSEKPEPIKIEAQPSVLIKTEVKKADPEKAEIKTKIFEKCLDIQVNSVNIAKKAMNDAQESANEEKGSMEEKFDSFRESMHVTRDMYARQYQEGVNSLTILKRINPNLEHNTVILGSVVYTDFQNYFVSVSLGEINVNGEKFITISTLTPLFQALAGKSKGDKFKFRDQLYTILDVF
jgi:hypothetical protein